VVYATRRPNGGRAVAPFARGRGKFIEDGDCGVTGSGKGRAVLQNPPGRGRRARRARGGAQGYAGAAGPRVPAPSTSGWDAFRVLWWLRAFALGLVVSTTWPAENKAVFMVFGFGGRTGQRFNLPKTSWWALVLIIVGLLMGTMRWALGPRGRGGKQKKKTLLPTGWVKSYPNWGTKLLVDTLRRDGPRSHRLWPTKNSRWATPRRPCGVRGLAFGCEAAGVV